MRHISGRFSKLIPNDDREYDTHTRHGSATASNFFFDTFSPAILNPVMKVVYFLFGWAIKRFK